MPKRERVQFANAQGQKLAAALELPDRTPRAFALFAHCFTCGKNNAAASRISRSLTANGFAVLRFDFTGLGDSEGDFANSDFSANIADLSSAAGFLRSNYDAPRLLIGHSLGGTAVLAAAEHIPEAQAVVTIGAPSSPSHLIKANLEISEGRGDKAVNIAGREFRISERFVEDLKSHSIHDRIAKLRKALLVFHAPFDDTVAIDEATTIFSAAKHPKSFISLDDADHLVSRLSDAQYIAATVAAWADRYLPKTEAEKPDLEGGEVFVGEGNQRFLRDVHSDDHAWLSDEPKAVGGDNLGPDPYEHLLAALGTCTSMTIRMYANRKQWPLDDVGVRLQHRREHARDCEDCDEQSARVDVLQRAISLRGDLDESQRARLMEIADRCPVHRTLEGPLRIETEAMD